MRNTRFQRVASFLLVFCLLLSGGSLTVAAEEMDEVLNPSVTDKTIADYREELESISYGDYVKNFGNVANATETIIVNPIEHLDMEKTTLDWLTDEQWEKLKGDSSLADSLRGIYATEFDGQTALYTPGDGTVTFTLDGITEGLYSIRIVYYPVAGKAASIEREFYINGKAPFKEARSLTLPKVWKNVYSDYTFKVPAKENADEYINRATALGLEVTRKESNGETSLVFKMPQVWTPAISDFLLNVIEARFFVNDLDGNELRPTAGQAPEWCVYDLTDSQGYEYDHNDGLGARPGSFQFLLTPD